MIKFHMTKKGQTIRLIKNNKEICFSFRLPKGVNLYSFYFNYLDISFNVFFLKKK